jgi:hypothetical protein
MDFHGETIKFPNRFPPDIPPFQTTLQEPSHSKTQRQSISIECPKVEDFESASSRRNSDTTHAPSTPRTATPIKVTSPTKLRLLPSPVAGRKVRTACASGGAGQKPKRASPQSAQATTTTTLSRLQSLFFGAQYTQYYCQQLKVSLRSHILSMPYRRHSPT